MVCELVKGLKLGCDIQNLQKWVWHTCNRHKVHWILGITGSKRWIASVSMSPCLMAATANLSTRYFASFPGHGRNSLATSASSNCYFRCQKAGITNQISECCHMTTIKPNNCVMHWTVTVTPIHFNCDHSITLVQVFCTMIVFRKTCTSLQ